MDVFPISLLIRFAEAENQNKICTEHVNWQEKLCTKLLREILMNLIPEDLNRKHNLFFSPALTPVSETRVWS